MSQISGTWSHVQGTIRGLPHCRDLRASAQWHVRGVCRRLKNQQRSHCTEQQKADHGKRHLNKVDQGGLLVHSCYEVIGFRV